MRSALLAVPILAATIVACALLTSLGWWIAAMIVAVFAGIGLLVLTIDSVVLMIGGLLLCAVAGIMTTSIETPLFGATARGIPVDQATAHAGAAVFRFNDGRVLTTAALSLPVYGGSKGFGTHQLYRLRVAPIVGDQWTPDQPITAWAVTSSPTSNMPPSDWTRPSRAGVRVVSSSIDDIRAAIARARQTTGLISAPNAVLLHWLDDPEAAIAGQRWKLFVLFCICVALWGALVVAAWIVARRR